MVYLEPLFNDVAKSTAISYFSQVIIVFTIVLLNNQSNVVANIKTDSFHLNDSRIFEVKNYYLR